VDGFWAVFWLAVVMKIPIAAVLWLVWYAVREPAAPEHDSSDGRGGSDRDPHPRPRHPRPPRRGPHAEPAPPAPKRVRARARKLERAHH
jgi:hypothetical protein